MGCVDLDMWCPLIPDFFSGTSLDPDRLLLCFSGVIIGVMSFDNSFAREDSVRGPEMLLLERRLSRSREE